MQAAVYLVATPIGNLEDITLRALRTLRECDLIACEDTRHTRKLLNRYEVQKPLISCHEHNERERAQQIVERVLAGQAVAIVSDAGLPGISDPGYRVVQAAIAAGVRVIPIPGPSAVDTAIVASGLPTDSFLYAGFLPARSGQRIKTLEALAAENRSKAKSSYSSRASTKLPNRPPPFLSRIACANSSPRAPRRWRLSRALPRNTEFPSARPTGKPKRARTSQPLCH